MVVSVEFDACEVEWQFAEDRKIRAFAYNGEVPGPLIEAEVGDTVEVRLTNSLPQATTIHWHGVRVPAHMDGTEAVQAPVEPGGTFEYRFVVQDAGTFWYHSHTNETEQLERGLYGGLVVRQADEPIFDGERVLILDDLKLDADDEVAPFGDEHEHHAGREGDVRLVNGALEPELEIPAGTVERWRIVDAANTRFVRLSIGGKPFRIIGTDGGSYPSLALRRKSSSRRASAPTSRSARSQKASDWRSRHFPTTAVRGSPSGSDSRASEWGRRWPRAPRYPRGSGRSIRSWTPMSSRPGRST
jgi:FtsP/CotA-like multicopper oxidase with cupredoxin domain